jgi:dipeptidyl aminopeptidase/acylaminoacyl peptidase
MHPDLHRLASCTVALCSVASLAVAAAATPQRPLEVEDFDRFAAVDGVVCSRDGRELAYTVEQSDLDSDERKTAVWMVDFDGGHDHRLTEPAESASSPKFSPDGRYLSFLASRASDTKRQIYLLDLSGGEPQAVTGVPGEIADYDWSPDGRALVISMSAGEGDAKTPPPIVIDRLHFKEDQTGYLTAGARKQLYLVDVATRQLTPLTTDRAVDDTLPVYSPDGRSVAFFSTRDSDPDRSGKLELYVLEVGAPGEPAAPRTPRKLTEFFAPNKPALAWTPDGTRILYTSGLEPRFLAYIQDRLNVVTVADGRTRSLTGALDRAVAFPAVSAAGDAVNLILEDDGSEIPVTINLDTGHMDRRVGGKLSATSLCAGGGHVAVVASTDSTVPEVHAVESGGLRKLTAHNDAMLAQLSLGAVQDISFPSRDGTLIHGLMTKPSDYHAGRLYPTILWIHGGPNGQDSHGLPVDTYPLELERQWFAAHGYVVLAVNYRGSAGRGAAFAGAIVADWGHREVEDLLGAVDYAVREKIADPRRLGVGGWSYGGILTDYLIASDTRFKAAIAGAGSGNQLSMYGSDEYVLQYNAELGPPWASADRWLKVSYPFFHAERIKTPTLFLGGDKDFNVPVAGGEQMYEALRTLGVPTELIVYPGQYHLLTRPSYIKDRIRRYLDWFDRYLASPRN